MLARTFRIASRLAVRAPVARLSVVRAAIPARLFSVSALRSGSGIVDRDLSQKLKEELKFETENTETLPDWLKEFQNRGTFKIEDKPGDREVTLVRHFGNEKISIVFSTDALTADNFIDQELEEESSEEPGYPVQLTVLIEKKSGNDDHGALQLAATVQDGAFFIDNISFFESSSLAADTSAEADWQRRGKYSGPVFADLDETLQDTFLKFLEERGFDPVLAEFIPSFVEYKEQKEYINWLHQISGFVSA
ncbi:mitochondrial glycoprotein [Polychytrium aggregatum]|uniref:mitochondrial glycoprotein n=1 Tax=Polychytrium aggregatum TaxID=110093 RepID=UPI0022FDEA77|nr:mitochondrial glycoprotein [Polychytrium aggregatum]KAI9207087.1 mitochondrial glycoprotein [Polychytrium aggregatum]